MRHQPYILHVGSLIQTDDGIVMRFSRSCDLCSHYHFTVRGRRVDGGRADGGMQWDAVVEPGVIDAAEKL